MIFPLVKYTFNNTHPSSAYLDELRNLLTDVPRHVQRQLLLETVHSSVPGPECQPSHKRVQTDYPGPRDALVEQFVGNAHEGFVSCVGHDIQSIDHTGEEYAVLIEHLVDVVSHAARYGVAGYHVDVLFEQVSDNVVGQAFGCQLDGIVAEGGSLGRREMGE